MSPSNTPCSEIYLDANATTAILPAAREAVLRTLDENYGNPGSPHGAGLRARTELENARRAAATMLGLPPERLIFNSGATEGIQTSILSDSPSGRAPLHSPVGHVGRAHAPQAPRPCYVTIRDHGSTRRRSAVKVLSDDEML